MGVNFFDWTALFANNFWQKYFKDNKFLSMHFDILNLLFSNLYFPLCDLYKTPKTHIPIKIYPIKVLFDQPVVYGIGYNYGDDILYGQYDQIYILTNLKDIKYIYDRPINPTLCLEKDKDFYYTDRIIFTNDKIKQIKIYTDGVGSNLIRYGFVWGAEGYISDYNPSGLLHPVLNSVYDESSIIPLLKFLRLGPAKKYLIEFLGKYFNTPYTQQEEYIENITNEMIITSTNTYSIPEGQTPIVEKGKTYPAYTFLTDGVILNDIDRIHYIPLLKESHANVQYIHNTPIQIEIKAKTDIPSCYLPILSDKFYNREKTYPYKLAHVLDPTGFDSAKTYIPWISLKYEINTLKFFWNNFLKDNYYVFYINCLSHKSLAPLKIIKQYRPLGCQIIFIINYPYQTETLKISDHGIKEKQFILQKISDKIKMKDEGVDFYSTDIFYV